MRAAFLLFLLASVAAVSATRIALAADPPPVPPPSPALPLLVEPGPVTLPGGGLLPPVATILQDKNASDKNCIGANESRASG